MKYIAVLETEPGGMFCIGIYDSYNTALGKVMVSVFEEKAKYKDDGAFYEFTDPYEMEGEGGDCIDVTYKASCWEKPYTDHYYILFANIGENGDDIG